MTCELVLKDAQVLIGKGQAAHLEEVSIGITLGKITNISSNHIPTQKEISLKGWTVLPGLIDTQVHFREPGLTHKEDLESGTRGAAMGGITSVFEMPNTNPATTTTEAFNQKMTLAMNRCWVDYAFYIGASPENIKSLTSLEQNIHSPGIKLFMGSSTGTLLVADDELLEQVFMNTRRRLVVHAEDEFILKSRKHLALESGKVQMHPSWRSEEASFSATDRLLRLARKHGRKVHVLHVTSQKEVELLEKNKDIASFEILPQHLTLAAPECYDRLGTLAQQNPPIRELNHQDALWRAIRSGSADVLGSDHAPHTLEEKLTPYPGSPSGMPGVQTIVPVMLNHVAQGKLSLGRFTELMTRADLFGLQNKGKIEIGFDADFSIVDLKAERTIENKWIQSRVGWTPFHGLKVRGWPQMTMIRGETIMREGELLDIPKGRPLVFSF